MNKKYVLIDYENIQPADMQALDRDSFHVIVFVGANQTKVTYEAAEVLQRMGERGSYIKIAGNGNNALDFHIAFYIGELTAREPDACFHVVSKDTGFDPLIQHLKSRKISVNRVKTLADLSPAKAASRKLGTDRVSAIIANLTQMGASKPRTLRTLASTINAFFQKTLSEAEVEGIIAELTKKGIVVVNESKVAYAMLDGLLV
jgi:hypothetical protein